MLRALNRPFCHPIEWIAPALILLTIKLWLLANYAPEKIGEYYYFDVYSDRIMASSEWLTSIDLYQEGSYAIELKKMIGMSLIFVVFKALFGNFWYYPLSLFFSVLSSLAAWLVFTLARQLGVKPRLAALSAFLYMLGPPLISDIVFWSDGFYSPLTIIAICLLSLTCGYRGTLLAGLFLALAALSRASLFIALPAFFLGGWMISRWKGHPWLRAFYFILPTLLLGSLYGAWNAYRTGYFLLTTDASTALISPIFLMASQDPNVLKGQTALDLAIQEFGKNSRFPTSYQKAGEVSKMLVHQKGFNHIEVSQAAQKKFYRLIVHHYDDIFNYFITNVKSYILYSSGFLTVPMDRARDLYHLSEDFRNLLKDFFKLGSDNSVFYKMIDKLSKIIFVLMIGGFLFFLFLWFSLKSLQKSLFMSSVNYAHYVISGLVIIYFGLITPILIIGMEPRYLGPVAFIPCIVLVYAASTFSACQRRRPSLGSRAALSLQDQRQHG